MRWLSAGKCLLNQELKNKIKEFINLDNSTSSCSKIIELSRHIIYNEKENVDEQLISEQHLI